MRISDWSSDVCSSDLRLLLGTYLGPPGGPSMSQSDKFVGARPMILISVLKYCDNITGLETGLDRSKRAIRSTRDFRSSKRLLPPSFVLGIELMSAVDLPWWKCFMAG